MNTEDRRLELLPQLLGKYRAIPGCGLAATVGVTGFDDCAVIPLGDRGDLVIGSDFVRGEGFLVFRRGLMNRFDIGYYLVGANASDVAAMGARPLGIVVVCRYANDSTDEQYKETMEGVAAACEAFNMPLLGGDSGSYSTPVLSASALGICRPGQALLRSNGKGGDRLFLTGSVGLAGALYAYLASEYADSATLSREELTALLNPWRRVAPALEQGAVLSEQGLSSCAIDTSDGLLVSALRLAVASSLDAVILESSIPTHPAVEKVARLLGVSPLALSCGVSVDFRLLFSASADDCPRLTHEFQARGWPLHDVGFLRCPAEGEPAVYFQSPDVASPPRRAAVTDFFG